MKYSANKKFPLVVRAIDYQPIVGHLYKLGIDGILRCCVHSFFMHL